MILGATNRPNDIDAAILRRMPKRYPVTLPDATQREKILRIMLKDTRTDPKEFKLSEIVRRSAGLSGSDLKELCRNAAMIPVREYLRSEQGRESMRRVRSQNLSNGGSGSSTPVTPGSLPPNGLVVEQSAAGGEGRKLQTRPLKTSDFFKNDAEVHIPTGAYNSQRYQQNGVNGMESEALD